MTTFEIAVSSGGTSAPPVEFQVHRAGCADVGRGIRSRKYSHAYKIDGPTATQVVFDEAAEYLANEQGYDVADFQIMDCALTLGHGPAKIDTDTPTSPILEDGPKGHTMTSKTQVLCGCGCGEHVTRRFKPGHDARLKGEMLRAYRSGVAADKQRAQAIANDNGWERYLTDQPAKVAKPAKTKPVGFAAVRVKVGRWTYDGILIEKTDDEVVVEYKGAGGKVTRKTLKPSAIVG